MYAGKAISAETTLNLWWSIAPVNTSSGASCVWDILRSADTLLIATADCCKRGGSTVCSSACDHNQNRLISPINLDLTRRFAKIFCKDIRKTGVLVKMGRILDSFAEHMNHYDDKYSFILSNQKESTRKSEKAQSFT